MNSSGATAGVPAPRRRVELAAVGSAIAVEPPAGTVEAVSVSAVHGFSKRPTYAIWLLPGFGVEDDAHRGVTVQHRSRVARDPSQLNLRQVHLIHAELHEELRARGFDLGAGDMGENVTTCGVDLLALPTGTRLRLGRDAVVEITGLRNPCRQLEDFAPGLMAAVLGRTGTAVWSARSG